MRKKFYHILVVLLLIIITPLIVFAESNNVNENVNLMENAEEEEEKESNSLKEESNINNTILENESDVNNDDIEKTNTNNDVKIEKFLKTQKKNLSLQNELNNTKSEEKIEVSYKTHVQDLGWQEWKKDGETAGTSGKSLRLEGINIKINNNDKIKIKYRTHIQDIGWQEWKYDGDMSGTSGKSLRLEGIKIELENSDLYSIAYRVHVQNIGWQEWKYDGEIAGTEGKSYRLEAIEIKLIEKREKQIHINYQTHIQDVGWQEYKEDGIMSGTSGRGLRLEGIKIYTENLPKNSKIRYKTHVQNIGWQDWKNENQMSGTSGQGLRLEGIKIQIEGTEEYSVMYRTHVENIGWQDWCYDGETSGTEGEGLRLEAIQIKIVDKFKEARTKLGFDTLPKNMPNETNIISGWVMTNVKDTKIQLFLDGNLLTEDFTRQRDQSVYNRIKGYGGEELNPKPYYETKIDFSKYNLGQHSIIIRVVSYDNHIITEQKQTVNLVRKVEMETGVYGISGLKVAKDPYGSDLRYYKYGSGPNVLFATFCVHGFEDEWEHDGYELVKIADAFWEYLKNSYDYEIADKWTIYIFPEINPDGRKYGWTNNGPGRTTIFSAAPNYKGVDINRCWSTNFTPQYSDRYYTGDSSFLAYEARYLRDFLLAHKSQNGQTILVDLHGWTQQLIGDEKIREYYRQYFPENTDTPTYGKGYLIAWAKDNLYNNNNKRARSALIELPGYIKNSGDIEKYNIKQKYINATLSMLRGL